MWHHLSSLPGVCRGKSGELAFAVGFQTVLCSYHANGANWPREEAGVRLFLFFETGRRPFCVRWTKPRLAPKEGSQGKMWWMPEFQDAQIRVIKSTSTVLIITFLSNHICSKKLIEYVHIVNRKIWPSICNITDERIYFWTFKKSVVKKAANSIR